ncbi:MAG: sigma factor-like helix-turn-helix DNA-binding protein [Thermoguttaceae bacterium]
MTRKRATGKALAERRRRVFQLYVAGFTQEEIAEKVGVHRSVVSRNLQSVRESVCPGESADVQEACFIQMERMKFNPRGLQFDPTHPPLAGTFRPEEVAESWKERRVYDPIADGYGTQLKL